MQELKKNLDANPAEAALKAEFDQTRKALLREMFEEYGHEFKGFWVVDEAVKDFCDMVEEAGIGDSYCYGANTQRKSHCHDHAIKTVE